MSMGKEGDPVGGVCFGTFWCGRVLVGSAVGG